MSSEAHRLLGEANRQTEITPGGRVARVFWKVQGTDVASRKGPELVDGGGLRVAIFQSIRRAPPWESDQDRGPHKHKGSPLTYVPVCI